MAIVTYPAHGAGLFAYPSQSLQSVGLGDCAACALHPSQLPPGLGGPIAVPVHDSSALSLYAQQARARAGLGDPIMVVRSAIAAL